MKVRIQVTIDVNPEDWAVEFGLDRGDVRSDVQTYFDLLIHEHLEALGLGH